MALAGPSIFTSPALKHEHTHTQQKKKQKKENLKKRKSHYTNTNDELKHMSGYGRMGANLFAAQFCASWTPGGLGRLGWRGVWYRARVTLCRVKLFLFHRYPLAIPVYNSTHTHTETGGEWIVFIRFALHTSPAPGFMPIKLINVQ